MADFIPARDAELDAWLLNFKTLVTADPTAYGLITANATALSTAYANWHAAYVTASDPSTRTPVAVAEKNGEKLVAKALFREIAAYVRGNPTVPDANKLALGIRLVDPVPTPIPPPTTRPVVGLQFAGPLSQTLVWADETTPLKRAKPAGVAGVLLYKSVGTVAATDPAQATFDGLYTRTPQAITFEASQQGKVCTYFARWTNSKGEEGPWSTPLVVNVM